MRLKKFLIFSIIFICICNINISFANNINDQSEDILELNNDFWNSNNIAIGVFFSSKYEKREDSSIDSKIDNSLNLYVTNNGKDFIYLGETGLTGRDPNIMYKDGVFYLATTKGGDSKGRVVINIFKSTDLVNWTNIYDGISKDEVGDTNYRYSLGITANNKYNLTANTWSPKWFSDEDKTYILVSTSRFTDDGGILYYIDSSKDCLVSNKLTTSSEYSKLKLNTSKGVLVKESAVLDEYGNPEYNKNGTIITKKEFYRDNKGKLVQAKCPFYTNNKYSLFDTYIVQVTNFGTENEKMDINFKNLSFDNLQKVDFESFSANTTNYTDNLYYLHRSMLGGYLLKNDENSEFKYTMYTKTDPYGTVQRWVSNSIEGKYYQIDDSFYPSTINKLDTGTINCTSTKNTTSHYNRLSNNLKIDTTFDDTTIYEEHFEGSFINNFGNDTIFYSDHYVASSSEVGKISDENYIQNLNTVNGVYYSVLDSNTSGGTIDFGKTNDHIRFNTFSKVNVLNSNMKPTFLRDSHLRNGTVYTINQAINQNNNQSESIVKEKFINSIKNASKFNVISKCYKQGNEKYVLVLKSNRAISNKEELYNNNWKYLDEIKSDSNVDEVIKQIYTTFEKTTPYCFNETYIYKIFDSIEQKNAETISLYDMNNNQIIFNKVPKKSEENTNPEIPNSANTEPLPNIDVQHNQDIQPNISIDIPNNLDNTTPINEETYTTDTSNTEIISINDITNNIDIEETNINNINNFDDFYTNPGTNEFLIIQKELNIKYDSNLSSNNSGLIDGFLEPLNNYNLTLDSSNSNTDILGNDTLTTNNTTLINNSTNLDTNNLVDNTSNLNNNELNSTASKTQQNSTSNNNSTSYINKNSDNNIEAQNLESTSDTHISTLEEDEKGYHYNKITIETIEKTLFIVIIFGIIIIAILYYIIYKK